MGRMSIDSERPSREQRLAGTLLGMVALAGHAEDPTLVGALRVLASLREKHRLVLSDVRPRWAGLPADAGRGAHALPRAVPLALWLRGPDHRLTTAALHLAAAQDGELEAGLGSALTCHWLRALYRARSPVAAWKAALERTQASLLELGLEEPDTAAFMRAVGSESLATTHSIAHALHAAHAWLVTAEDFAGLAGRLQHPGAGSALRLLVGAAGGMWFGDQAIDAWLGDARRVPQCDEVRRAIMARGMEMHRLEQWPTRTSASHPLPIAVLRPGSPGRIGVSPCPGLTGVHTPYGNVARDLEADLDRISAWGARHVLCLVRGDDLHDVGLGNYEEDLRRRGLRLWHLPVVDADPDPWFEDEWRRIRPSLAAALRQGEPLLIHHWDWDEGPARLAAELVQTIDAASDPAQAVAAVEAAITLARIDAARLDADE